jgi:hypothetical protein
MMWVLREDVGYLAGRATSETPFCRPGSIRFSQERYLYMVCGSPSLYLKL